MKTIDEKVVLSCPFFSEEGVSKRYYQGYQGWLPAEREIRKPKEGYNIVQCKYYIQESGKCQLQHFMPTPWISEHNPCVFAES